MPPAAKIRSAVTRRLKKTQTRESRANKRIQDYPLGRNRFGRRWQ